MPARVRASGSPEPTCGEMWWVEADSGLTEAQIGCLVIQKLDECFSLLAQESATSLSSYR